jgi:membrane protease YdiL (CAAX protease family)
VWLTAYLMLADSIDQAGWRSPHLTLLFWSVLVYPPLEEIIFRGGLQPALLSVSSLSIARYGITLANIITSAVFAAVHLITQPPLWALLVFVPSLVFGAARDRYDGITASIILHMFYNAGFVGWLAR